MIRRFFAAAALVALACGPEAEVTPPSEAAVQKHDQPAVEIPADLDAGNLLNVAAGAAVVSRTAELDLENSAAHAIDGIASTRWSSPAGDANQTLVFSLGAPARINKLGVFTNATAGELPDRIRFSASADGASWREVHVATPKVSKQTQLDAVPPFETQFLRVETVATRAKETHISSVHAVGEEIYAPQLKRFGGCWTIDGRPALLVQRGARITGVIGDYHGGPTTTVVDGGTDGRVARLMWMRGPQWGYAAVTLTPDARELSAVTFHQNPLAGYVGRAWFGQRCTQQYTVTGAPPEDFIARTGFWTLAGVAFDEREQVIESLSRATLDDVVRVIAAKPSHRFRIVAHEFRFGKEENRQRTASRIASLRSILQAAGIDEKRVEFVPAGDEWDIAEPGYAVQRLLWSRIDLEVVQR